MIFTKPVRDNEGNTPDYSKMNAAIHIPVGKAQQFFGHQVGTIEKLHKHEPLINSYRGGYVPEIHTDGIFYHPGRQKWIIWRGEVITQRTVTKGLVSAISPNMKLKVQFDPRECEVIDPKEMLYQELISFNVQNNDTIVYLPIRPEFIDLIDLSRKHEISSERLPNGRMRVQIPLLGAKKIFDCQCQVADVDYHPYINVWPNQKGWKSYWLTTAFKIVKDGDTQKYHGVDVSVFTYRQGLLNRSSKASWGLSDQEIAEVFSNNFIGIPYESWPDMISLSETSVKGCTLYLPEPINHADDQTPTIDLGIDFGTARSVLCIAHDGVGDQSFRSYITNQNAEQKDTFGHAHMTGGFSHQGRSIVGPLQFQDPTQMENYLSLVTGHEKFPVNVNRTDFPRSIVLETGLMTAQHKDNPGQRYNAQHRYLPYHNYTLVIPGRFNILHEELNQYFKADKWVRENYQASRINEGFFKQVLTLALAEIWSIHPNVDPTLSCSIPLAFTTDMKVSYEQAMRSAIQWLQEHILPSGRTINWNGQLISESKAAYSAAMIYKNPLQPEFTVVADLGGGTLDISIWTTAEGNRDVLLVSDSVEIGADNLLDILVNYSGTNKSRSEIYVVGYGGIKDKWTITENVWSRFIKATDFWLTLVSAYLARTIAAPFENDRNRFGSIKVVNVLLAGGGWKTVEAKKWSPNKLSNYLKEDLKDQLKQVSPDFNADVRVHTRLHTAGLDKIAIAGGLHSTQNLVATDGLLAPNGFDEITSTGEVVPWYEMISDQPWHGHADESKLTMEALKIANVASEDYIKISADEWNELCGKLANSFTQNGNQRTRTFASLVFEHLLKRVKISDII